MEVLLVELEQFHHVAQTFDLVLQALVDHDVDVELLVAPVDFEYRLEASQEGVGLDKCAFHDLLNARLARFERLGVADPGDRIEGERLGLFPLFPYNVVPLFQLVCVVLKISVLRPSGETLNFFQTELEVHHDLLVELFGVWLESNPEFVGVGQGSAVQLRGRRIISLLFFLLGLFIAFGLDCFDLEVAEQIEVLFLRLPSRRQNELIDGNLADFFRRNRFRIVELHVKVEKRLVASLGLAVAIRVVKVHFHDFWEFFFGVGVQILQSGDHFLDGVSVNVG